MDSINSNHSFGRRRFDFPMMVACIQVSSEQDATSVFAYGKTQRRSNAYSVKKCRLRARGRRTPICPWNLRTAEWATAFSKMCIQASGGIPPDAVAAPAPKFGSLLQLFRGQAEVVVDQISAESLSLGL